MMALNRLRKFFVIIPRSLKSGGRAKFCNTIDILSSKIIKSVRKFCVVFSVSCGAYSANDDVSFALTGNQLSVMI